jgi:dipeptidyl aminopeptidase/acylaminoacyl peptidase
MRSLFSLRTLSALPALLAALLLVSSPLAAADPAGGELDSLEAEVARMARIGSAYAPSFSPDGSRVAFISDLSGLPQVWIVDAQGGWPDLLTSSDDQVSAMEWSPDGAWIAFSLAPGGGLNEQIYLIRPDGGGLTRITEGGKVNNRLSGWTSDGRFLRYTSNRRDPAALDGWLYDVTTGESRLVAENPGIGNIEDVSRDGRRAVVFRLRSRGDSNLYLVDLESGKEALLTPHEPPGSVGGGTFSPDGRTIWLGSNLGGDLGALARVRLGEDGSPGPVEVVIERPDAELADFAVTEDGRTAALMWNAAGRNELEILDFASLERTAGPALPGGIAGGLDFSKDGRLLALSVSGARMPSDVWVLDRPSGRLRQVTRSPHAGVDLGSLVEPELVRYPAHDGLELSGWLYRPKGASGVDPQAASGVDPQGASGPGPVVVSFHGGPEGQERPRFNATYQALLARGISVFAPNVRGSSGFGKRFVNLDNGALRFDGIRDIRATTDFLVASGVADPGRLGIMGGSYGGYMTMAGVTEYPDLFAAGANLFGIVNFETFFSETEPWMAAISTVEYGDPATQRDLLRKLSPIHKLDRVKAPLLVLHGANDTNVPVVEAEQVVESLRGRGVPVEYILFPDEGHGFRKAPNRIRSTTAIVRWFEERLRPSSPASQPAAGRVDSEDR